MDGMAGPINIFPGLLLMFLLTCDFLAGYRIRLRHYTAVVEQTPATTITNAVKG